MKARGQQSQELGGGAGAAFQHRLQGRQRHGLHLHRAYRPSLDRGGVSKECTFPEHVPRSEHAHHYLVSARQGSRQSDHPGPHQEQAVGDLALADQGLAVGETTSGGGDIHDAGLHVGTLARAGDIPGCFDIATALGVG